ncbi:MAG: type II toxin-antitoxin system VapC family toxin [Thermoanaerobaculia bacterium]
MKVLLDTHFLVWLLLASPRLLDFPWLLRYVPWGVSPVSLLEIQLLEEIGRIEVDSRALEARLAEDARFVVDEVPLLALIRAALDLGWTRDPFDRLLAAHSTTRRLPLCTTDGTLRKHHRLLVGELAS